MPHKHTRKRNSAAVNDYNLAPPIIAKPLPAFSSTVKDGKGSKKQRQTRQIQPLKRKRGATADYKEDDTPRAFARLMQFQTTGKRPSDLDDDRGTHKAKKRKTPTTSNLPAPAPASVPAPPNPEPAPKEQPPPDLPKLLPGERLADYAARVDRALPVSGLARKGNGSKIEGMKERTTKTEKRLKKMYAAWREEDVRRKEKVEEQEEMEEEREEERGAKWGEDYKMQMESGSGSGSGSGKGRRRRRVVGEVAGADDDGDDDPWAVLNERRERPKGLHDVVQAPPTLKVVPKEKFKVRNGAGVNVANVPAAAGSLKRREELGDARRDVIERYRVMMKGKGGV